MYEGIETCKGRDMQRKRRAAMCNRRDARGKRCARKRRVKEEMGKGIETCEGSDMRGKRRVRD